MTQAPTSKLLVVMLIVWAIPAPAGADGESTKELAAMIESAILRKVDLPFLDAPLPDRSELVAMPDGVRLAVSLFYPEGFDASGDAAPAVYEDSVYGRREEASTTAIDLYRAAGYVVVISDARGFAASFGAQQGFNTAQQTADEAQVIGWIAQQPWSNGQVAAIGHSVSAVFADSMTSTGAPELKAAVIRASDFDEYEHNMFPGGVPNRSILALATELMGWHAGGECSTNLEACREIGFQPVDGDEAFTLLQAAIRDHSGNLDGGVFQSIVYRDDAIGGTTLGGAGAIDRIEGIQSAGVPARVSASWIDGVTALGAITRFQKAPDVPMEIVIGATTHAGGLDADPFSVTPFQPADPNAVTQFEADVAFVDRALSGEPIGRSISYVVLGTDTWETADTWPPPGVVYHHLSLAADRLTAEPVEPAVGTYRVDENSTSGPFNRWAAQRGTPIFYGDRRTSPGDRLTFDGVALPEDQVLLGSPELCLVLSSDQTDGLVIAYLEDVAPDGRVTYLTEGLLRLLHRKTAGEPCDPASGTERSFAKVDGAEVVPGETMRVELPLFPVAALIRKGHHLRLSLAGTDAGWFEDVADAPASWVVAYGGEGGSRLFVSMRPWDGE